MFKGICSDCGFETVRTGSRGPAPKRCAPCKSRVIYRYPAARRSAIWPKTCVVCRLPYVARSARGITCSKRCRTKRKNARPSQQEAVRRRRERLGRFAPSLTFRLAIYQRDGWVCQLCGDPVDSTRPWNDPGAATLDHIVVQSAGGGHGSENLRLAHRYCNALRGNGVNAYADLFT